MGAKFDEWALAQFDKARDRAIGVVASTLSQLGRPAPFDTAVVPDGHGAWFLVTGAGVKLGGCRWNDSGFDTWVGAEPVVHSPLRLV